MIFTVVGWNRSWPRARSRCSTRSSTCSRPRSRSHHSAPTTRAVSRPSAASDRYASSVAGVTHASCHPVIPRACRCRWAASTAASHSSAPGRRDHLGVEPVRGALVQRPGRFAGHRVALDPAVRRVRGARRDAAELEGAAVGPGAVHVPVEQEHGPVGHDGVEVLLARRPAGEVLHRPPAAEHPRLVGVVGGVAADDVEVLGATGRVVQPHPAQVPPGDGRVHVAVLEAGEHQPAWRLDHARARAAPLADVVGGPHRHHPVAADGDRLRVLPAPHPDPGPGDQQVGVLHALTLAHARLPAPDPRRTHRCGQLRGPRPRRALRRCPHPCRPSAARLRRQGWGSRAS